MTTYGNLYAEKDTVANNANRLFESVYVLRVVSCLIHRHLPPPLPENFAN